MLGFMFTFLFSFAQALSGLGAQVAQDRAGSAPDAPAPAQEAAPVKAPPPAPAPAAGPAAPPAAPAEARSPAAQGARIGAVVTGPSYLPLPLAPSADSPSAGEVVGEVQAFYKETDHLRARFRQTVHDPVFGRDTTSDGWVYIDKPGKMRWDYYGKPTRTSGKRVTKSFISDGKTLWAVHHDDKTALRKSLEEDLLPVAVTFLYGKGDLSRDFEAALDTSGKYGGEGDYVLELTPKRPSAQYKTLWLVVDGSNFRVKQSVVLNAKGETNSFRFYEPDMETPIPDRLFGFDLEAARSKGYRLIQGDQRR